MIGNEVFKKIDEEVKGVYIGKVIKNDDPDDLRRIKARVFGVYDKPISKEHIPWFAPVIYDKVPALGDYVVTFFLEEDVNRPLYLNASYLGEDRTDFVKDVYKKILDKKNEIKVNKISGSENNINVNPIEDSNKFTYNKDVDIRLKDVAIEKGEDIDEGNPDTGALNVTNMEKDNEFFSKIHPSGSFFEVNKEGTSINRIVKDFLSVIENDAGVYVDKEAILEIGKLIDSKIGIVDFKIDGGSPNKVLLKTNLGTEFSITDGGELVIKNSAGAQYAIDLVTGLLTIKSPSISLKQIMNSAIVVTPSGPGSFAPPTLLMVNMLFKQ